MALDIQSKEIIDNISRDLKVQPALQIPRRLSENIQLVYSVLAEPERLVQAKSATASDATSATAHTTHAIKETFLIGVSMAISKSALSDSTDTIIRVTPVGNPELTLLFLRYEPSTAGNFTENITFPIPIKLEKGTAINVANGTATASIDASMVAYFYEIDPQ